MHEYFERQTWRRQRRCSFHLQGRGVSVAQSLPSPEHRAASVRAALARGDLLGAYDEVVRRGNTDHQDLNYLEVLTLARLGDTERAMRLYEDYGLADVDDVDSLSLKARLLKDLAFQSNDEPNREKLLAACDLYEAVHQRTNSSYPAIHAASLAL